MTEEGGSGSSSIFISEVYGELRCGKTQLCHTMCVTAHLPHDMGDAGGKGVPPKRRGVDGRVRMSECGLVQVLFVLNGLRVWLHGMVSMENQSLYIPL